MVDGVAGEAVFWTEKLIRLIWIIITKKYYFFDILF